MDATQHVRCQLAESRRAGVAFDAAWKSAVAALPANEGPALRWARPAYERAYLGEAPTDGEAITGELVELLADAEVAAAELNRERHLG